MKQVLHAGTIATWCALVSCTVPALAQEALTTGESAPASNRVTYGQEYFATYNVSTAEDMLRLLPGVTPILDATVTVQQRGFGSAGARVLINGRRFPGKANEISTNLRRIPSSSVARVELISGTAEGISVQSDGILVNVVLREGEALEGSGAWETNLRANDQGWSDVDGLFSYNGIHDALSYSLGIERNMWSPPGAGARYTERFRDEVYYFPDGNVLELRPQEWIRDHEKWIYTGSLTYDFARGDRAQVNALYQTLEIHELDRTPFTRFNADGQVIQTGLELHDRINDTRRLLEISGDYESRLGTGDLRALFIHRRDEIPTTDVRSRNVGSASTVVGSSEFAVETGEDIARVTYGLPLWEGHSLESGGEIARNSLKQDLTVGAVVSPTSEVEELRAEAFLTHRWTSSAAFSVESTLTYEASQLTTNFPFIPERTLTFIRPRIDARYRPTETEQYRLLLDRAISQLDFNNFVPRFDTTDALNPRLIAGNPGIEPEKTWTIEAGYERRLPGDTGLIELRAFYKDITDTIDRIPLCRQADDSPAPGLACVPTNLNRLYSAEGNIPSAELFGAEIKASIRLTMLSLPDALLSVSFLRQESKVDDPFADLAARVDPTRATEERRLRNERGYNLTASFRHDLRDWGASYGFTYQRYGWDTIISDLPAREYYWMGPTLDAFVEKRLTNTLTLRLELQNLLDSEEKTRLLYAQNAVANGVLGPLSRFERYDEDRDMRIALRLRGRF